MTNLTKPLLPIMAVCILTGCTIGIPKTQIRQEAEIKREGLILKKNYQVLLKCWDERADKQYLVSGSNVYSEIGEAEIVSVIGGDYSLLIELKRIDQNHTRVNAYGQGYLGETYIPLWLKTMQDC